MQFGDGTDLFDMSGRVVIVTGASAGIGRTLATGLAGQGAHVVLAARREEMLVALEQELPGSLAVRCDIGVDEDRAELIERALRKFGRIDGLVNNAGILGRGVPATRESTEEFVGDAPRRSGGTVRSGEAMPPLVPGAGRRLDRERDLDGSHPLERLRLSAGGVLRSQGRSGPPHQGARGAVGARQRQGQRVRARLLRRPR